MLSKLHGSLQGLSLGHEQASSVVHSVLHEVLHMENRFRAQSLDWADEVVHALRLMRGVEEGSRTMQVCTVKILKDHWDDLPVEFKRRYNFSIDVLTLRETNIMPSTMDNYIRAVETFIFSSTKPFQTVKIPERDPSGKPVVENNQIKQREVEWDPTRVPITKLARMTAAANRGLMDPGQPYAAGWSMMMDPYATVEEIDNLLYNSHKEHEPSMGMTFRLEGTRLIVSEMGETAEFGELYFDMGENDLCKRAIYELLRRLSIPFEENVLARQMTEHSKETLIRIYQNGGSALVNSDDA